MAKHVLGAVVDSRIDSRIDSVSRGLEKLSPVSKESRPLQQPQALGALVLYTMKDLEADIAMAGAGQSESTY